MPRFVSSFGDVFRTLAVEQKRLLAELSETTPEYLEQLAGCHRKPSVDLSKALVSTAAKLGIELSLSDCRPDIWAKVKAA